jgi:hypothetical protein
MNALGYAPRVPADPVGLADPQIRRQWQGRNMVVYSFVSLKNPPLIIDIFIEHPIPFRELIDASTVVDYDQTPVRICSIEHLIRLKQMANRPKDLEDIEALNIVRDERDNPT